MKRAIVPSRVGVLGMMLIVGAVVLEGRGAPVELAPERVTSRAQLTRFAEVIPTAYAEIPADLRGRGVWYWQEQGSDNNTAGPGSVVYYNTGAPASFYAPGANVPMGDDMQRAGAADELVAVDQVTVFGSIGSPSFNVTMQLWTDNGAGTGPRLRFLAPVVRSWVYRREQFGMQPGRYRVFSGVHLSSYPHACG
jgi:hypothetical protein